MTKAKYIDGFVLTIPKTKIAVYRKLAADAARVWKRFGALDYKECMIDDAKPKFVVNTFGRITKQKPSETVWFSYITYKNRKHRDAVNTKVMKHFDKKYPDKKMSDMPFDMKRMSYAGFSVEVSS